MVSPLFVSHSPDLLRRLTTTPPVLQTEFGLTATARESSIPPSPSISRADLPSLDSAVATSELSRIKLSQIILPSQLAKVDFETTEDNSAIFEVNVSLLARVRTKITPQVLFSPVSFRRSCYRLTL